MSLVNAIHHVSVRCADADSYEKEIRFYRDVLEFPVFREWDGGIMLGSGTDMIEICMGDDPSFDYGAIRHFAFDVDDVDECARRVKAAGMTVRIEPKDIVIPSEPALPARLAFAYGPCGEEIEFFCVKA